jgi:hypothetical protein
MKCNDARNAKKTDFKILCPARKIRKIFDGSVWMVDREEERFKKYLSENWWLFGEYKHRIEV